jgi:hypothetical protein
MSEGIRGMAWGVINRALDEAARPAVLWSGGKDSTLLLHMVRRIRPEVDVILWGVPWLAKKWDFHRRLIAEWGLTVFDFMPAQAGLCYGNGRVDVMEDYLVGASACMTVARGTYQDDIAEGPVVFPGRDFVCGREWLERPKGVHAFPWDVLLHGHKSCDVDPCSGQVPLKVDVVRRPGAAAVWYPLRHWSDEDVTECSLEWAIPWDERRYDLVGLEGDRPVLKTRRDLRLNSDYYKTCLRCVDRREGDYVRCPLTGLDIENVSGKVRVVEPSLDYCGLREKAES